MADKEEKPADAEGGGEDDAAEAEKKRGCCDKFSECLVLGFQKTAKCITGTCGAMATGLGYFWYPTKEKIQQCCERGRNKRHPWTDPAYHQI
jgi:hypothetical protein